MDQEKIEPDAGDDDDMTQSEKVTTFGEEVAYCTWNGGAPGYSGSTRIYSYEGQFWVYDDGQMHGPFATQDEAEDKFPYFYSVDEDSEEESAIMEVWDKAHGVIFQRKSLHPLTKHDERFGSVWVVDNKFVTEPWVGGLQLGELPEYDVSGKKIVNLTQGEFDALMEKYRDEHGHYPDT